MIAEALGDAVEDDQAAILIFRFDENCNQPKENEITESEVILASKLIYAKKLRQYHHYSSVLLRNIEDIRSNANIHHIRIRPRHREQILDYMKPSYPVISFGGVRFRHPPEIASSGLMYAHGGLLYLEFLLKPLYRSVVLFEPWHVSVMLSWPFSERFSGGVRGKAFHALSGESAQGGLQSRYL